jgi:hypothetical protein
MSRTCRIVVLAAGGILLFGVVSHLILTLVERARTRRFKAEEKEKTIEVRAKDLATTGIYGFWEGSAQDGLGYAGFLFASNGTGRLAVIPSLNARPRACSFRWRISRDVVTCVEAPPNDGRWTACPLVWDPSGSPGHIPNLIGYATMTKMGDAKGKGERKFNLWRSNDLEMARLTAASLLETHDVPKDSPSVGQSGSGLVK